MVFADKRPRQLILIGGAPLSGKSTLAAALSKKLGLPWVSTDDVRKWMQLLVCKDDYQDLFYGEGMDAAAFYKQYTTAAAVLSMENRQSAEVQKGLSAMIDSFWWWNEFILEGLAITPAYVKQLQTKYATTEITPIFLVDHDQDNIKRRLDARGLWDEVGTYPDQVKPQELAWTILCNEYYEREAAAHNFPIYDSTELRKIEQRFSKAA